MNNYRSPYQSKFYDHIVPDRRAWETIRQYLIANPRRWQEDWSYRLRTP